MDETFRARTYEASLTRNPAFRERFGRFVEALVGVKRAHDPLDRLHDHELGDPAYRSAVGRVIAECFPPRVTLPELRRDVRDHRTRVRLRLVGPAQGRTDNDDLRRLRDQASYFEFAAEQVGLYDLPACPRAGSLDDLFAYSGALLRACEAAEGPGEAEPASAAGVPQATCAAATAARADFEVSATTADSARAPHPPVSLPPAGEWHPDYTDEDRAYIRELVARLQDPGVLAHAQQFEVWHPSLNGVPWPRKLGYHRRWMDLRGRPGEYALRGALRRDVLRDHPVTSTTFELQREALEQQIGVLEGSPGTGDYCPAKLAGVVRVHYGYLRPLGDPDLPDPPPGAFPTLADALNELERYRRYCIRKADELRGAEPAAPVHATADLPEPEPDHGEPADAGPRARATKKTSRTEVVAFIRRHLASKPFPGVNPMAELIGCSSSTVSRVVNSTDPAHADIRAAYETYLVLAAKAQKSAQAGQMTELQGKSVCQAREADPAEQVAADEFVRRLIQQVTDAGQRDQLHQLDDAGRVRIYRSHADGDSDG